MADVAACSIAVGDISLSPFGKIVLSRPSVTIFLPKCRSRKTAAFQKTAFADVTVNVFPKQNFMHVLLDWWDLGIDICDLMLI